MSLLVRIPAKLKNEIAGLAERQHRSINKQIEFLLERAIRQETNADQASYKKRTKQDQ